jgi:hypothetical protein
MNAGSPQVKSGIQCVSNDHEYRIIGELPRLVWVALVYNRLSARIRLMILSSQMSDLKTLCGSITHILFSTNAGGAPFPMSHCRGADDRGTPETWCGGAIPGTGSDGHEGARLNPPRRLPSSVRPLRFRCTHGESDAEKPVQAFEWAFFRAS